MRVTKPGLYKVENKSGKPLKMGVNSGRLKMYYERKDKSTTLLTSATITAKPSSTPSNLVYPTTATPSSSLSKCTMRMSM